MSYEIKTAHSQGNNTKDNKMPQNLDMNQHVVKKTSFDSPSCQSSVTFKQALLYTNPQLSNLLILTK